MKTSKPFDPLTIPLSGNNLIEASAGTGKTFSIALLFLRLILEAEIPINRILVVTYTKAATAELKDRIRQFLRMAMRVYKGEAINNKEIEAIVNNQSTESIHAKNNLLNDALLHFDECAILTIHGFCKRVLQDNAFEVGVMHNAEMQVEQSDLIDEVIADFYRKEISKLPLEILPFVIDELSLDVLRILAKQNTNIDLESIRIIDDNIGNLHNFIQDVWQPLKILWNKESASIKELFSSNTSTINQATSLSSKKLEGHFANFDRLFLDGDNAIAIKSDLQLLRIFSQSFVNKSTKKNIAPIQHNFFNLCEKAFHFLSKISPQYKKLFIEYLIKELRKRKDEKNIQGYDDLISHLYFALKDKAKGKLLAEALSNKFAVALIDEFQDTDNLQYEIFTKIFVDNGILFLIGDPKQSIYRFRGADIFTYMNAGEKVDSEFTLGTNYRSEPPLVEAFNTLFDLKDKEPFIYDAIKYERVKAVEKTDRKIFKINNKETASIIIWEIESESEKPVSKSIAQNDVNTSIASEIISLCSHANIGEEKVKPGDIAILVESWYQARAVKDVLNKQGIPAIMTGAVSVFASEEANELLLLLRAVIDPSNEAFIKGALVTTIIGYNIENILAYNNDDLIREQTISNFRELSAILDRGGFMAMITALQQMYNIRQKLMRASEGERRLTNFLHLAELIHNESQNIFAGKRHLLRILTEKIEQSEQKEEYELRLESDANAVIIRTIHGSKGLEYPIVFCPFQWAKVEVEANAFKYHDNDKTILLLGGGDENAKEQAEKEMLSEKLRLFYVAVTRAKNRCYLAWGNIKNTSNSAAQYFLSDMKERFSDTHEISIESLPANNLNFTASEERNQKLELPIFTGSISLDWKVSSFTAMSSTAATFTESVADHDEATGSSNKETLTLPELVDVEPKGIFAFPKGARPGNALHKIFESIDFAESNNTEIVKDVLHSFNLAGQQDEHVPVIEEMIQNVLRAPLTADRSFCLADIPIEDRMVEMSFFFSVNNLSARDFTFLEGNDKVSPFTGYVNGFIDLVFRANGRYYILDWKSNYLGSKVEDYNESALHEAIIHHKYNLQYMIYTLALHRYLSVTDKNYDYEKHFGGVFYVFLRGAATGDGSGIYYAKPTLNDVKKMDELFGGKVSPKAG